MATKRGSGAKTGAKKTSSRGASGGPAGNAGGMIKNLIVYALAGVGGVYLGTQAYSAASQHFPGLVARAAGKKSPSLTPARSERSPETATSSSGRRERRERTRRAVEEETPKVEVRSKTPELPDESSQVPENAESTGLAPPPVAGADETAGEDGVIPMPPLEIERGSGKRKEVALTFDAGSDWKPVRKILDTLASHDVRSTFFLTGEWTQENPKSSRRIAELGHELGNHSWDHSQFTGLTDDQIREQIRRTDAQVREVTGRGTRPYFRPPHGARNRRVLEVLGKEGYLSIYWSLDSWDSVKKGITAEQIRDRVLSKIEPGGIVLLHCGSQATADALPEILEGLKTRSLTPVTVSRLLEE